MELIIEPFRYGFMQSALIASVLIGISSGFIGVYVVLRRMAFIGDALAHSILPGLVIASLYRLQLSVGALLAGMFTALGIGWLSERTRLREDTAIGVAFTAMFAFGVMLASRSGSYRDLSHMLFGNLLGVNSGTLWLMGGVTVIELLLLTSFHKELQLATYDSTYASAIGIRTGHLRYLLLMLLALAVVTGIQAVGVILISALLVTPAATASLITDKLPVMIGIATAVAVTASVGGLYISYYADVVAGPAVVLLCTAIFGATSLVATFRRGRAVVAVR